MFFSQEPNISWQNQKVERMQAKEKVKRLDLKNKSS